MRIEDDSADWVGFHGGPPGPRDTRRFYKPSRSWSDLSAAGIPLPAIEDRHVVMVMQHSGEPDMPATEFLTGGYENDCIDYLWCAECDSRINLSYQVPRDWTASCPYNQALIRALMAIWPVAVEAARRS